MNENELLGFDLDPLVKKVLTGDVETAVDLTAHIRRQAQRIARLEHYLKKTAVRKEETIQGLDRRNLNTRFVCNLCNSRWSTRVIDLREPVHAPDCPLMTGHITIPDMALFRRYLRQVVYDDCFYPGGYDKVQLNTIVEERLRTHLLNGDTPDMYKDYQPKGGRRRLR